MANSFGTIFKVSTFGESHGLAIGVLIDGCPAGLVISEDEINEALSYRAPGKNSFTTPRKEKDEAKIISGVFEGKTTGTPILVLIQNLDADTSKYEPIKEALRPGHANFTYLEKYGIFDYRGGGRASGRETACRVIAGCLAEKFLELNGITLIASLEQVGHIHALIDYSHLKTLKKTILKNPIYCADSKASKKMEKLIDTVKEEGDSIGGVIAFFAHGIPVGLGEPIYDKLDALLSFAMLSIPAAKGFEIGTGFASAQMRGSFHNDLFVKKNNIIETETNYAGGILGGISTGMPIYGRVAFKPTSSIKQKQTSLNTKGKKISFMLPEGSRHDPCVAIRAVPVVKAMLALVLADTLLLNRCSKV